MVSASSLDVGDFPDDVDRVGEGKRDVLRRAFTSVKTSRPARVVRGPYRAKDRKDNKKGFQIFERSTKAISVWYSVVRHHTRFSISTTRSEIHQNEALTWSTQRLTSTLPWDCTCPCVENCENSLHTNLPLKHHGSTWRDSVLLVSPG